jgi:hypothetical protein
MSSQDHIVSYKEGVLHVPCRMVLGKIQSFKIIKIELDFRALFNRESQGYEYSDYLIKDFSYGVEMSPGCKTSRDRDINLLSLKRPVQLGRLEYLFPFFKQVFNILFCLVK